MEARSLQHDPSPPEPAVDWERFYRDYRKPGFIPGYEIGHKLGGGAFGIVYKARKESIGKAYAIKFLRVDDVHVRRQVVRELESVQLFAQVDHPNLVTIEDQGIVDSVPYIVMGYGGDETLRDRLAAGRLGEDAAVAILVQVLRGVQALHDRSLIHFDLKPANIFLRGDVARVGDYGLSKLVSESCMTLSMGRGTPYYMAPEMLRRRGDHRSDIYSLGVIFFECLAGVVPFTGESEWEVLKAHEEGELVFPHAVPDRLRPVIARMLAKDPAQRFQSVGAVLEALRSPEEFGRSVDVEALTKGRLQPAAVASRRRTVVWSVALGLLAAIVGVGFLAAGGGTVALGPLVILILIGVLAAGLAVFAAMRSRRTPRSAEGRRVPVVAIVLPALLPILLTMRRFEPTMWMIVGVVVAVAVGATLVFHRRSRAIAMQAPNTGEGRARAGTWIATLALGLLALGGLGAYLLFRV